MSQARDEGMFRDPHPPNVHVPRGSHLLEKAGMSPPHGVPPLKGMDPRTPVPFSPPTYRSPIVRDSRVFRVFRVFQF